MGRVSFHEEQIKKVIQLSLVGEIDDAMLIIEKLHQSGLYGHLLKEIMRRCTYEALSLIPVLVEMYKTTDIEIRTFGNYERIIINNNVEIN